MPESQELKVFIAAGEPTCGECGSVLDRQRARACEREAVRRAGIDREYLDRFAQRVRDLFPHCPPDTELAIAHHACLKYSGRVGRSAAAKALDEQAVQLAVAAHVRHAQTGYDVLLATGHERHEARRQVQARVTQVLATWRGTP